MKFHHWCLGIQSYKWHNSHKKNCGTILQNWREIHAGVPLKFWCGTLILINLTRKPSKLPLLKKNHVWVHIFPRQEKGTFFKCISWMLWLEEPRLSNPYTQFLYSSATLKLVLYLQQMLQELWIKSSGFSTLMRKAVCCISLLTDGVERLVTSLGVLSELIIL